MGPVDFSNDTFDSFFHSYRISSSDWRLVQECCSCKEACGKEACGKEACGKETRGKETRGKEADCQEGNEAWPPASMPCAL